MNNTKKGAVILCLLLLGTCSLLFATSLESVVPNISAQQLQSLRSGDIIKATSYNEDITQYAPVDSYALTHLKESLNLKDSFTVISTILIPYPPKINHLDEGSRQIAIFNTMRSISTQEGITYISHRAGNKPKVLIEKSWYLETPKSRSGQKDPISYYVPKSAEYFVYQRDSSFGSNVYSHNYTTNEKEIFVKVKNLETIRVLSLFKAVAKEQLAIAMSTYQTDEGLLLTAMATISGRSPQVKVLGITVDLPSAFTRRTTALGEWFIEQLNQY